MIHFKINTVRHKNFVIAARRFFSRISTQIILIVGITVVLVLSVMVMFFYHSTVNIIRRNTIHSNEIVLEQINRNFESYVKELQSFALNVRMDSKILSIMEADKLDYIDQETVGNYLKAMYYSRHDLYDISLHLLLSDTSIGFSQDNRTVSVWHESDIEQEDWFQAAAKRSDYAHIMPAANIGYTADLERKTSTPFLKIYRVIINAYTREPLAAVEITCDMNILQYIFDDLKQDPSSMIYLTSSSGTPYFISNIALASALASPEFSIPPNTQSRNTSVKLNDRDYLFVCNQSAEQGFLLAKYISVDTLTAQNNNSRNISMLALAIATMITLSTIAFLVHLLTLSLQRLAMQMNLAGKGDLKTRLSETGSYETKLLARQYNSMITQIDDLISKNYIMEINEKTAKLQALETQINPHFLYNSLQVISSHTLLSGNKESYKMIESLADNLRYAFKESVLVPVQLEVRYIRNYLLLLHARFDERLSSHLLVEPEAENLLIPKLAIFTLIENSIIHGLEESRNHLHIAMDVKINQENLIITVSDNGPGITASRLSEVLSCLEEDKTLISCGDHLGLQNLKARLKLYFGNDARLLISSIPNRQTITTIIVSLKDNGGIDHVSCINY